MTDQVYTGSAIKVKPAVYDGTKLLTEGVDYRLSYVNNKDVNDPANKKKQPKVTITGTGNYSGSVTVPFNILPYSILGEDVMIRDMLVAENGKVQSPLPVAEYKGKKLSVKKDFTVQYATDPEDASTYRTTGFKEPGAYYIIVSGKGSFSGTKTIRLQILNKKTQKALSKLSFSLAKSVPYTEDEPIKPVVTVKDGKETLEEDKDYTVTYQDNDRTGTATVM